MERINHAPNDADLILSYLQDESPTADLPDKLRRKLQMMEWAHTQIRQHKKPSIVANMLVKSFSVSKTTALIVIREMQLVFGTVNRKDKEYWRNLIVESIWEQIGKAKKAKDYKSAKSLYDSLIKAQGLDRESEVDANPPQLPYLTQQIIFMPQSLGISSPTGNTEKQLREFLKQFDNDQSIEEISENDGAHTPG